MAWGLYQDQIPEGTVKKKKWWSLAKETRKPIICTHNRREQLQAITCIVLRIRRHQWEELPVTGLPAGNIRLSQLTVFKNAFYAISEEGTLYRSTERSAWVSADAESAYAVRALLGCIRPMDEGRQAETLTGVVEAEGSLVYAKMTDETTGWELGAPVASGFR